MRDFPWPLFFLIAVIIGVGFLFWKAAEYDAIERAAFMTECVKERKEYECTAMWRAGEPKYVASPVVMPMYLGR